MWLKVDVEPRKDRHWLTSEAMQRKARNNQGLQDQNSQKVRSQLQKGFLIDKPILLCG